MVIATTAHPAFRKAADEYLVKVVECPVDDKFRMDIKKLKTLITSKTILIVCSCPTFPHGAVDPIEDVSMMLTNKNIRFACRLLYGQYGCSLHEIF